MANRWYVALDGEQLGPLSDTGLERLIQGGRVDNATMVRNGASGEWITVELAEELLAARPSRQRPGEAAIQAAQATRLASRAQKNGQKGGRRNGSKQRQASSSAPPAGSSDNPLVPPPLPSAQAVSEKAPDASDASAPASAADVAPAGHSPLVWASLSGGAAVILAVSLLTGWLASGAFSSSTSSTPPTNPSANVSPELAALQQQAEQLQREVEEAKARQTAPAEPPMPDAPTNAADAPPMPDSPPVPDGPADEPPAVEPGAAPQKSDAPAPVEAKPAMETAPASPEAKPDKEDAPAPSQAAGAKESAASPKPRPVDLAAERKALAEQIAVELAYEDELARTDALWELKDQELENALGNYSPQVDVAFDKHLPQAEAEVADLDLPAIKVRRQEIERLRQAREEEAHQLLAQSKEAIEQLQFVNALRCAGRYAVRVLPDERPAANQLLQDLKNIGPYRVYSSLNKLTEDQVEKIGAGGPLPPDWPDRPTAPLAVESILRSAQRLAPLNLGQRRTLPFLKEAIDARKSSDFAKGRKLALLLDASDASKNGKLTPQEAKRLIDLFGTFSLDGLEPLVNYALVQEMMALMADEQAEFIPAVARGEGKVKTYQMLYDEVRTLAADAWTPEDQTNPFAGQWQGGSMWQLEIDPEHDVITWTRAAPQAKFEQRICKLGAHYLVAYEKRPAGARPGADSPFKNETYGKFDQRPDPDGPPQDETIAFTYYTLRRNNTLHLQRRLFLASFLEDYAPDAIWGYISKPVEFRQWRDQFRRVDAKTQP